VLFLDVLDLLLNNREPPLEVPVENRERGVEQQRERERCEVVAAGAD
jgi:hypothetical protein